jgi:hypothetical protein
MKVIIFPKLAARALRLLVLAVSCLTLVSFAAQTYAYLPQRTRPCATHCPARPE